MPDKSALTLEKEKVVERLINLETQYTIVNKTLQELNQRVNNHGDRYEGLAREMCSSMLEIRTAVIGTTDKPGLGERIRSLEKTWGVAWAGFLGAVLFICNTLKDWFIGHK